MLSPSPARWLEWLVAAGSLFLLTNALDTALHSLSAGGSELPLARAILIPFFAASLLMLLRRARKAAAAAAAAWPVMLLVGLAAASFCWSTDPPITARWVLGLVGTTIVGVFLAVRFDAGERLEVVCAALGAAACASAVLLPWPQVGIRTSARGFAWAGVFEDNNLFGRAMSLSALAFLVLAVERRERRVVASAGLALSAILLLGSRSLAARVVAAACLLAVGGALGLRRQGRTARRRTLAIAALAAVLGAAVVVQNGARVAALLGRDTSLSGRTRVWSEVVQMAGERLWFGHGYATFWPRAQTVPVRMSPRPAGFPVRHPHNGFLEIFFELGLVGIVGFVVPFLFLLRRALVLSWARAGRLWPLAYLLFIALSNVAESDLLRHKIFWALYVAVAVDLCGGASVGSANRIHDPGERDGLRDRVQGSSVQIAD